MPIRINLLAEAQEAEEIRRRDPVKRAIWATGTLVVLALLWAGVLQLRIAGAQSSLEKYEQEWAELKTDFEAIREQQKSIGELERKLAALDRFSENRFLWATVLDVLQQTVAEQVQLTQVRGEQVFRVTAPVAARRSGSRDEPAKPGYSIEQIGILIEGRDHRHAQQNYNTYRMKLAEFPFFQTNLQRADAIRLTSLSQPVIHPSDPDRSFVQFSLQCQFPEIRRDE
jgi:hypothetical protein